MSKQAWKLDTPIMLKFFVRTEILERTFAVIQRVKPRILFLVGDGPRNEEDRKNILKCREILENIDWQCEVYRYYSEHNRGVLKNSYDGINKAFQIVDRLIVLEDDMLCSESFFWYCQELLEKYKDDLRIQSVCGLNIEGVSQDVCSDYFFARRVSSGCMGIWKNRWDMRDYTYPIFEDQHLTNILERSLPRRLKGLKLINKAQRDRKEYLENPLPKSGEVIDNLYFYMYNMVNIIPKYNMAVSIGLSAESAHTPDRLEKLPKGIRSIFELPVHEIQFPLKHPKCVMPDVEYEDKWCRVMAVGYPMIELWRLIEKFFLYVKYDGFKKALSEGKVKMKRRFSQKSNING